MPSPFRRHKVAEAERDPRTRRLVANCPTCGMWFSFVGDRVNNGGMYQVNEHADKCPHCGNEPEEVFPLDSDPYVPAGTRRESKARLGIRPAREGQPAIEAPDEPPPSQAGKVYKRAAFSRNTAGMGMAPVEGTEE